MAAVYDDELNGVLDWLIPFDSCLTVHWWPVTFLAGLRMRSSRRLSSRQDLILLTPVFTGPSLIFQFYQSSWNDLLLAS